jgi:hypothetical protein
LALRQFVAGVQSVAGVHDYKMCGYLPRAPRRSAAPSQGDGGILVKRALVMFLFESVKLKSYEEDYFLTEKGPHLVFANGDVYGTTRCDFPILIGNAQFALQ